MTEDGSEKKIVEVPASITVGELADKLDTSVANLISALMRNGVMATVNEKIDFDIAQIITEEIDESVELAKIDEQEETDSVGFAKNNERSQSKNAQSRPPIVAVMGHVDHGKTSLMDAIKSSNVADAEAGGITQHISAWQVEFEGRAITMLDTPGHEAFQALREHGAQLTDVVVIVVAADDGIKPQTEEAIKFAVKANVKIVVAINKVDKPEADINRTKQQLTDAGLQPEDWGGSTVCVEVSALQKTGIDDLLNMILLVSDIEELRAEREGMAEGLVIEAHIEQGRGAVATLLIEHGMINKGAFLVSGDTYARVKTLQNGYKQDIDEAGPATPAVVTGFKEVPRFGDKFIQFTTEKEAKKVAADNMRASRFTNQTVSSSSDMLQFISKKTEVTYLPVVIKTDVQGSVKSVVDALRSLKTNEVAVRVVASGVGELSENDITTAAATDSLVLGFGLEANNNIKKLAEREQVKLETYNIIYELIDSVKQHMSELIPDEIVETEVGEMKVKGVFRVTQKVLICGGEVTNGAAKPDVIVDIKRDDSLLGSGQVVSTQKEQLSVKELKEGETGGLEIKTNNKINLKEGDTLRFYTKETIEKSL